MADDEQLEELPEPRRHTVTNPPRRFTVAGIVVILVAVLGLLLTRHHSHPAAKAAPSITARTTSAPLTTALPARVSSPPKPACLDVGDSTFNCGISGRLPRAVVLAVRGLLPGAVATAASTVTGRDGAVYSRRVTLQTRDGATLQLRIGPRTGQSGTVIVPGLPEATVVQFAMDRGRRHVELVVRTPPGVPAPNQDELRRLAGDTRLLAVA